MYKMPSGSSLWWRGSYIQMLTDSSLWCSLWWRGSYIQMPTDSSLWWRGSYIQMPRPIVALLWRRGSSVRMPTVSSLMMKRLFLCTNADYYNYYGICLLSWLKDVGSHNNFLCALALLITKLNKSARPLPTVQGLLFGMGQRELAKAKSL